MADHYHAVVWIDHKRARDLHFNADEADRTLVRDSRSRPSRPGTARRQADRGEQAVLRGCGQGDRRRRGDPRWAGAGEGLFRLSSWAEKHPAIRAHVEGVEKADHPSDGELLDFARRYVKAADRMRP